MASVYKTLSRSNDPKQLDEAGSNGVKKTNKQKTLMLTSRGVSYRHRHLLRDFHSFMPASRLESKLDTKTKLYMLNELAELYNCNNIFYFLARKQDLYAWFAKAPNGPSIKVHCQNLASMEELRLTGNSLRGSRPILSFDAAFDQEPHLRLVKEVFLHIFGVPKRARGSKPFIDRVMGFTLADGKVWIRNYQINETEPSKQSAGEKEEGNSESKPKGKSTETEISLTEIGPRVCFTIITILEGSMGGPVIYENKEFVSPNQVRSEIRMKKAGRYSVRADQDIERQAKKDQLGLKSNGYRKPRDALDTGELFA